jgi:hypothetical protein
MLFSPPAKLTVSQMVAGPSSIRAPLNSFGYNQRMWSQAHTPAAYNESYVAEGYEVSGMGFQDLDKADLHLDQPTAFVVVPSPGQ